MLNIENKINLDRIKGALNPLEITIILKLKMLAYY